MNRILLEPDEVDAHGVALLTGPRARHLTTILKVALDDEVRIGLVNGPRGTGRVHLLEPDRVGLQTTFDGPADPRPRTDLVLALPRPKVMKRLWPQLAALGVDHIHLIEAWKVEKPYWSSHVLEENFYRPLLLEGLQQSGTTALPEVSLHRQFRPFIEGVYPRLTSNAFALSTTPEAPGALIDLASDISSAPRVVLAVGPEGGWTPFEQEQFSRHGAHWAHIGPRILRTDTACVVLLGLLTTLSS